MRTPSPVLPPPEDQTKYQLTMFDRLGPDAGLVVKGAAMAISIAGAMSVPLGLIVYRLLGLTGVVAVLVMLAGILGTGFLVFNFATGISGAAGAAVLRATFPQGDSTPYEESYSYQESMAARGDFAGALGSYEAVLAEQPHAVLPRVRAAELYAQKGRDLRRAVALFREVRDIPDVPLRHAVYASSRLVDLYDGPLDEPGRALVELRRMIEQFPGSPVADRAREALPRLKARMAAEHDAGRS
ncbi:MAG: hypothetical protein H0W68_10065 [Gemmatimonadaceae bacterium]|nr:hypothetical protein [Gemmatimonadaceae bacterium]